MSLLKQRLEDEVKIEALRKEAELARVKAEEEARAAAKRANEDIHLRAMRAKAAEDCKKVLRRCSSSPSTSAVRLLY